ncbi:putative RNA recognition motif domain, RNA-binding domain superfamily [Helianthus anomalus]
MVGCSQRHSEEEWRDINRGSINVRGEEILRCERQAEVGFIKFYVTNLLERCSSRDIAEVFGNFWSVMGLYIAWKRDKDGTQFGFVNFRGVTDGKGL